MGTGPTLEELTLLNPRLLSFTKERLSDLMSAIQSCGWEWNLAQKRFELPGYGVSIRTEGLDMFDAESFRRHHDEIVSGARSHPKEYADYVKGKWFWAKWAPVLLIALAVDLAVGWIVLELKSWLISLVIVFMSIVALAKYTRWKVVPYRRIEDERWLREVRRRPGH